MRLLRNRTVGHSARFEAFYNLAYRLNLIKGYGGDIFGIKIKKTAQSVGTVFVINHGSILLKPLIGA